MTWNAPEWFDPKDGNFDEAFAAYDDAGLTESTVTRSGAEWFYMVKATSTLSEWPEVQTADVCANLAEGQAKCEAAVARIVAGRA